MEMLNTYCGVDRDPRGVVRLTICNAGSLNILGSAVINGVRQGLLTVEQACERYHLSIEEYRAWERDFDSHGKAGLRSTRVGIYRKPPTTR